MPIGVVPRILITVLLAASSLLNPEPVISATASQYLEQGLRYRASERYPEAIAALKKSVELDPKNISGQVILGWTLHLAGKEDTATQTLLQAASQDFFNPPTFNALGIVFLVSGKLASAVVVHSWATILQPDNEIAYYNLSLAHHRLKNYKLAIATANQATALEPNNPHPLVATAITYWDSGNHLLAQKTYRQAINLDSRYRDRTFLTHLKQAGFSPTQIQTAKKVVMTLPK